MAAERSPWKEGALELGAGGALGFAHQLPAVSGSKQLALALDPEVLVGVQLFPLSFP